MVETKLVLDKTMTIQQLLVINFFQTKKLLIDFHLLIIDIWLFIFCCQRETTLIKYHV